MKDKVMDREKDIGPIYDLYANKKEVYNNEEKINDIENSIMDSLLSKKEPSLCQNNETKICLNLLKLFLALALLSIGISFLVIKY